ncbi:WD40/YVTN/BNR-like repeat-containing protein [Burkholderia cenocepacia]|uniref:WD40/YVTN/BNR-like repeat-containing protein n=1 Tax=Burkholderia cenocepacia TaxID=95486 RepID=UPI002ABDF8AF|nr:YCF48-related protein [Burkholderia cenocepacia]
MRLKDTALCRIVLIFGLVCDLSVSFAASNDRTLVDQFARLAAERFEGSLGATMLGASSMNALAVAVGEHGTIVRAQPNSKSVTQARSVPTRATLTDVALQEGGAGVAVGQWGTILTTKDYGENWSLARQDLKNDRPLFSVAFLSKNDVLAAGLWGLVLISHDRGLTWRGVTVPKEPIEGGNDLNVYRIVSAGRGTVYLMAEKGYVLKSYDYGLHWEYVSRPDNGSLWAGMIDQEGRLVVGGLSGKIFRTSDGGQTWSQLNDGKNGSVTGISAEGKNELIAVTTEGAILRWKMQSSAFSVVSTVTQMLTGVIARGDELLLLSDNGVLLSKIPATQN